MARKIIHQLVDDLDGEVLEIGASETVTFSLDGTSYEIDLSEKNAAALRDALQPWIAAGRSVAGAGAGRARQTANTRRRGRSASGRDLTVIRAWAEANGHKVSDRGRVPESVLQAYDAAH